jgi:hypothetical protein
MLSFIRRVFFIVLSGFLDHLIPPLIGTSSFSNSCGKLPRKSSCTPHPNDTQYCPFLAPPNQTSQEITHYGATLTEARLTAVIGV